MLMTDLPGMVIDGPVTIRLQTWIPTFCQRSLQDSTLNIHKSLLHGLMISMILFVLSVLLAFSEICKLPEPFMNTVPLKL